MKEPNINNLDPQERRRLDRILDEMKRTHGENAKAMLDQAIKDLTVTMQIREETLDQALDGYIKANLAGAPDSYYEFMLPYYLIASWYLSNSEDWKDIEMAIMVYNGRKTDTAFWIPKEHWDDGRYTLFRRFADIYKYHISEEIHYGDQPVMCVETDEHIVARKNR